MYSELEYRIRKEFGMLGTRTCNKVRQNFKAWAFENKENLKEVIDYLNDNRLYGFGPNMLAVLEIAYECF